MGETTKNTCFVIATVVFCLVAALLLLAIPSTALADDAGASPAQAAQQAKGKNIIGKSNTKTLFRYGWEYPKHYTATKKTMKKCDVTGDKKADNVKFVLSGVSNGTTKALKIYVNGKKKLTLKENGGTGSYAKVQLATLKNGKVFLFVQYTGNNADGTYMVYQYKKKTGKFKKILSSAHVPRAYAAAHRHISSVKALGNSLKVIYAPMTYTAGAIYLKYSYPWKNGKLSLTSTGKAVYTSMEHASGTYKNEPLTASTQMTIYTDTSLTKKKATIWSYDEVTFLNSCIKNGRLLFKVKSYGQTGWMEAAKTSGPHNGTYFEETSLAG